MSSALRAESPAVLILDLDAGREQLLDKVAAAASEGLLPERVVGYFSHIDTRLGEAARDAGCRAVPRGSFWRDLPKLFDDASTRSP